MHSLAVLTSTLTFTKIPNTLFIASHRVHRIEHQLMDIVFFITKKKGENWGHRFLMASTDIFLKKLIH
jgi:hypothetical protein